MRRALFTTAACLLLVPLAALAEDSGKPSAETCGSFGTSVEFVDTPSAAARLAKKEQKLVFVLHVSGNFEDPRFT
jgi:hypothetical protein